MTPTSSHRPGADPAGSLGSGAPTGFDHVYDQPDPRGYFQALGPFEYQTPHHAQRVFRRLVGVLAPSNAGQRVTVLDICCSYGINAALLNHNLTLADLQARYTGPETTTLSVAELVNADRVFYAAHRHPTGQTARVIGLDPAHNAIDYARAVGLVDAGFAENLETTPAHAALLAVVRDVQLITITGGASFLPPRTFQSLLDNTQRPVWVAAFVLRTGSYQRIADALAGYGWSPRPPPAPFRNAGSPAPPSSATRSTPRRHVPHHAAPIPPTDRHRGIPPHHPAAGQLTSHMPPVINMRTNVAHCLTVEPPTDTSDLGLR